MTALGKGPVAPADNDLFNPLPREKLKAMGASALTDAEVLALLLRTGTRERPVVAFATDILSRLGGLRGLLQATPEKHLRPSCGAVCRPGRFRESSAGAAWP